MSIVVIRDPNAKAAALIHFLCPSRRRELAGWLLGKLESFGFDVWMDRALHGGDRWTNEIESALDGADVVLALLSDGSFTSDYCRAEQLWALKAGKRVIPIRVQKDCRVPLRLYDHHHLDFTVPSVHGKSFEKLLQSLGSRRKPVAEPGGREPHYNNTPPLPDPFVERPEILSRLRDALFLEGPQRNIGLTAVQGMGGIGKTVLAQYLCHDRAVRSAYPDGIFWFSIGKESRLSFDQRVASVPGLKRVLGEYAGEAACISQYCDAMRDQAALIVLDDAWSASDIEPFRIEAPRSRLLITTRDTGIAPSFGSRTFPAELLTGPESRQVLARWAGCEPESLPPPAGEIIAECGNLPLALAMTGAQLRGKPLAHWNLVLGYLRRADLAAIKARFPEPHTSLFRAIEVSFEALRREDAESARRYVALTVLLEDMTAAPVVQQTLWNTSDAEALQTATRLTELSLATFDETGAIRLHDLQLDYVRKQYPDAEALGLIHGAVRLSANAIEKDARQFAPQLVGRLLPHREIPAIRMFTEKLAEGAPTPWLQPLHEALVPPGTPLVRTLERSRFYCLWRGADAGRAARRFRIFGPHVEGVGPEEGLRAAHPGRSLWFCLWRGGDARRAVRRFRILGPYAEGVGPGEGPRAARASPISSVVWGSCRCNWRERHHPENLRRPQPDPP